MSKKGITHNYLENSEHFINIRFSFKKMHRKNSNYYDITVLAFVLSLMILLIDWVAVTFSAQCIWYLPLTISSAILDEIECRVKLKDKI